MPSDRSSTNILLVMSSMFVASVFGYHIGRIAGEKSADPIATMPSEEACDLYTYDPSPVALICESLIEQAKQEAIDEWRADDEAQWQSD